MGATVRKSPRMSASSRSPVPRSRKMMFRYGKSVRKRTSRNLASLPIAKSSNSSNPKKVTSRGLPRARYELFERFTCAVQTIKGTGLGQWWHRTFHLCVYVPGHWPRGVYPLGPSPTLSCCCGWCTPLRPGLECCCGGGCPPSTPHAVIRNRSRGPWSSLVCCCCCGGGEAERT